MSEIDMLTIRFNTCKECDKASEDFILFLAETPSMDLKDVIKCRMCNEFQLSVFELQFKEEPSAE
jgi:hypothetical protein